MNVFKTSEMIEFAIQIEKNGEKFYRESVKLIPDERIKTLFSDLADQELEHKKVFESFLKKVENYNPPELYNDDYFSYLRAYADTKIFNKKLPGIKEPTEAIHFALDIEKDSILNYSESKNFVHDDDKKILDGIIEEERKHFLRLWELLKKQ